MKRYVITGGSCVGKSTLIDLLAQQGHIIVPESARDLISEGIKMGSDILPWKNLKAFQHVLAQSQFEREEAIIENVVFLDRSLIDGYAYCRQGNVDAPEIIEKYVRNRYDKVFILERLPVHITDEARREDAAFAAHIHEEIRATYRYFGYEPISVPVLSPEERIKFIFNILYHC